MLTAQGICKAFSKRDVLHDVNISLKPGEITAVIGPSGAGKSTLLRSLSLLDPPDAGTVTVDDVRYSFPAQRQNGLVFPWPKLTVVFQQLFLWPHLTLRQNIFLPLETCKNALSETEITEILEFFELLDIVDRYPNQVSLGQRQRAALIRALALKPKYLLLDEITSALDVEHIGKVLQHLKNLRESGTSILLVTHLIGFAKSAADQVVFMENGRVLESGSNALLEKSTNERLARFLSLVETAI